MILPVPCGCGEDPILELTSPYVIRVACSCGMRTVDCNDPERAIVIWNRAMGD